MKFCEFGEICNFCACRKESRYVRRVGRVVEGARLERVYTLTGYQGFESLTLRKKAVLIVGQPLFLSIFNE